MAEDSRDILKTLESIQSLRELLKSEMSIDKAEDGKVKAEVKVYNGAPPVDDGSEVVFLGVGLAIIDGRERGITKWASKVSLSSKSEHAEERQKYNKGDWVTGSQGERFPAYTADENSYGQILFPGESLVYTIEVSEDVLPYLEIRVEGSVSRRHLFHISKPIEALKKWTQPLVVKTFQALDKIELYKSLLSLIDAIPEFSPQTTIADINTFRKEIEKAIDHVNEVMPELNKVYHSAPNQELRDLMKQHIGKYLTTSQRLCSAALATLSGSDTKRMKEAAEEIKVHLPTVEEVRRARAELISQFGIQPD